MEEPESDLQKYKAREEECRAVLGKELGDKIDEEIKMIYDIATRWAVATDKRPKIELFEKEVKEGFKLMLFFCFWRVVKESKRSQ